MLHHTIRNITIILLIGFVLVLQGCSETSEQPDAKKSDTEAVNYNAVVSNIEIDPDLPSSLAQSTSAETSGLSTLAAEPVDLTDYAGMKGFGWQSAYAAARGGSDLASLMSVLQRSLPDEPLQPGVVTQLNETTLLNAPLQPGSVRVEDSENGFTLYWKMDTEVTGPDGQTRPITAWMKLITEFDANDAPSYVLDIETADGYKSQVVFSEPRNETFIYINGREPGTERFVVGYSPSSDPDAYVMYEWSSGTMFYNDAARTYSEYKVVYGDDSFGGLRRETVFDDGGNPQGTSSGGYYAEELSHEFYDGSGTLLWTERSRATPSLTDTSGAFDPSLSLFLTSLEYTGSQTLYLDTDPVVLFAADDAQGTNKTILTEATVGIWSVDPVTLEATDETSPIFDYDSFTGFPSIDANGNIAEGNTPPTNKGLDFALQSQDFVNLDVLRTQLASRFDDFTADAPFIPETAPPFPEGFNTGALEDLQNSSEFDGM